METRLRTWIATLAVAVAAGGFVAAPGEADAKRLGGGKATGMQRQAPARPADTAPTTPAQPAQAPAAQPNPATAAAAPAAGTAAAAANAGKRSWLGPIAGLAAGIGLAALLSHFGLGGAFADFMMVLILAAVAVFVVRWMLRRFAGGAASMRPAGAGAAGGTAPFGRMADVGPVSGATSSSGASTVAPAAAASMPDGMDRESFERVAKMIFVRMQEAHDGGKLDELSRFTTPDLFASIQAELHERGGVAQKTDVVQLDAEVVDTARQAGQWVVSVRFKGLIREDREAGAERFSELWHFVRPLDGGRDWAIAGITPESA